MQFNTLYPHAGLLLKLHTGREGERREGRDAIHFIHGLFTPEAIHNKSTRQWNFHGYSLVHYNIYT